MYKRQPANHWSNFTNQATSWDASYAESEQAYFQIYYILPKTDFFSVIILNGELATDNIACEFKLPKDPTVFEKLLTDHKVSLNPILKEMQVYPVDLSAEQFTELCLAMKKANFIVEPLYTDICAAVAELQNKFQHQREALANNNSELRRFRC